MFSSEWLDYFRQNWRKQEGQTMAEYGVVLARDHRPRGRCLHRSLSVASRGRSIT